MLARAPCVFGVRSRKAVLTPPVAFFNLHSTSYATFPGCCCVADNFKLETRVLHLPRFFPSSGIAYRGGVFRHWL